jgi:hypothetical protein
MSMREDLDRLAGECQTCVMADEGSVYDHLLHCASCRQHSVKAEEIDNNLKMMDGLSAEDDEERRHKLGYEMNDIIQMTSKERLDAVKDMFDNLGDLTERQRRAIIRTHTDILLSLPKTQREMMLKATRVVYSSFPSDRLAREKKTVNAITGSYSFIKRGMVRKMYDDVLKR